jgi:inorganic pyrophosphatase
MPATLADLPTFDPKTGEVFVVAETPKGSRNKYSYDEELGAFKLAAVLPEGTSFPFDFGFIPSTLGEDGDPLDVLVLLDTSVVMGCVLTVRLIGVIEAEQRERNGKCVRNDRLLSVATRARTHAHIHAADDLRPDLMAEVEEFFAHYNRLSGKEFIPIRRGGAEEARKVLEGGIAAFRNQ